MRILIHLPPSHPSSWEVVAGVKAYCNKVKDYDITYAHSRLQDLSDIDKGQWCCVITRSHIPELDLPQVSVSASHAGDLVSVTIDEDKVAQLAVDHFVSMGLGNFVYFGHHGWPLNTVRWECFARYVRKIGGNPIFVSSSFEKNPLEALKELRKPCGILTFNDETGVQLLRFCNELGVKVPGDFHVVAIEDTPLCQEANPALTSVPIPHSSIGYYAADLCVRMVDGETVESVRVPPSGLMIRDSSKVRRIDLQTATEILSYLRNNLSYPIIMDDLVRRSSLSRRQLEEIFRASYGSTPMSYLKDLRLEQAKELLRTTDALLENIAEECGYSNSNQLCRVFRDRVGQSPGSYREEHRKD